MTVRPGPRNLITDVPGLKVGNAQDDIVKTGTTVLTADRPFLASVHIAGGAPGTRDTDLLAPDKTVEDVDAIFLSGGSAFGLDAGSGIASALARSGRGFAIGDVRVPIVSGAILFDLLNGGAKDWDQSPYAALGAAALEAAGEEVAIGTAGCGTGALCAGLKGGLGSASLVLPDGIVVGAMVGVNPVGQVTAGPEGQFLAAPFEIDGEFGGRGTYPHPIPFADGSQTKGDILRDYANTVIAFVATNAVLTKGQAKRMATAAHDGIARAITPSHTPYDGDAVFAVSTREVPLRDAGAGMVLIGHAAAVALSRAIARGVYAATPAPGDPFPTWRQRHGG